MGGQGQGQGGQAPIAPTPTGTAVQREIVETRKGDVIAREMVEGEQVIGEARARLQRISDRIARGHEQGLDEDPIPPHLRDVHQHYFGELKKRIDAVPKGGESPPSAEELIPVSKPVVKPVEKPSPKSEDPVPSGA